MVRAVLRYTGKGPAPKEEIERIRVAPGVQVLDASAPRMLLIEIEERSASDLAASFPSWLLVPEQQVPLPDTRVRVKFPPQKKDKGRR